MAQAWAAARYERAIQAQPDGPAYFYGSLGAACSDIGEYGLATQMVQEAVRRDPGNATYQIWLDTALAGQDPPP